jgi:hypothetical protein
MVKSQTLGPTEAALSIFEEWPVARQSKNKSNISKKPKGTLTSWVNSANLNFITQQYRAVFSL